MNFSQNMFKKIFIYSPKIASVTLHIPKDIGGIAFSDPQQFSELENFSRLGVGGGGCTVKYPGR